MLSQVPELTIDPGDARTDYLLDLTISLLILVHNVIAKRIINATDIISWKHSRIFVENIT